MGAGDDSTFGARHYADGVVGPPAFNNLDASAARARERVPRGEPLDIPAASTFGGRCGGAADRLSRGEVWEVFRPLSW